MISSIFPVQAWWGMIISALSLVGVVIGLITNEGHSNRFFPVNVSSNGALAGGVIAIIILVIYFYFSYQLLLGTQSVSIELMTNERLTENNFVILFVGKLIANVWISHHPRNPCRSLHPRSFQQRCHIDRCHHLRLSLVLHLLPLRPHRRIWYRISDVIVKSKHEVNHI